MCSRRNMRFLTLAVLLLLIAGGACSRPPAKQEKRAVNPQTIRLADIPEKYEATEFYISSDGRQAAYVVRRDNKKFLVYDGKEGQPFDDLHRVVFSPNGKTVAYRGMLGDGNSVVINGAIEKTYQSIGELQFAPDGRIVYEAQQDGKWRIVIGKRESSVFDMPYIAPMICSDRGKIAYIEQHFDKKKSNVTLCNLDMVRCTKGRDYDRIMHVRHNAAKSRLAYIVVNNDKMAVVTVVILDTSALDEKEGPSYDEVYTVDIPPDGDHLAYLARRGKSIFLVKDGTEIPFPEHDMRSHLVLASNGRAFNFAVLGDRFFAVVDGKRFGTAYDEMVDPVFSPDGTQLAYAARRGAKWHIIVNGVEGPPFDKVVSPKFSPDGTRLVYRVQRQEKRFVVVADTSGLTLQEQTPYEMVWEPVFLPDGKSIAYGVKTGRELWWKVEPLR